MPGGSLWENVWMKCPSQMSVSYPGQGGAENRNKWREQQNERGKRGLRHISDFLV